jgi:hypothetical protein
VNHNRISNSGRSRPDRFGLDQRRWSVCPGRSRPAVNCNPASSDLLRHRDRRRRSLRAVTRGVVPLRRCVTRRLTRSRRLLFLLASQTALPPSANPLGNPGLHHSHLPLLHGRAMASQAGRVAAPPADPPACDARRRQRTGTVQISSVRPQSPADVIGNASKHIGSLRADDLPSSTGSRPPQSQPAGSFGVLVCGAAAGRHLVGRPRPGLRHQARRPDRTHRGLGSWARRYGAWDEANCNPNCSPMRASAAIRRSA